MRQDQSIRDSRNTPALPNQRRWDIKPAARESEREKKRKKTTTNSGDHKRGGGE